MESRSAHVAKIAKTVLLNGLVGGAGGAIGGALLVHFGAEPKSWLKSDPHGWSVVILCALAAFFAASVATFRERPAHTGRERRSGKDAGRD